MPQQVADDSPAFIASIFGANRSSTPPITLNPKRRSPVANGIITVSIENASRVGVSADSGFKFRSGMGSEVEVVREWERGNVWNDVSERASSPHAGGLPTLTTVTSCNTSILLENLVYPEVQSKRKFSPQSFYSVKRFPSEDSGRERISHDQVHPTLRSISHISTEILREFGNDFEGARVGLIYFSCQS